MTSGRDEYLERKCIDYDAEAKKRFDWLNMTGGTAKDGITVEDYFAGQAMIAVTQVLYGRFCNGDEDEFRYGEVAEVAYEIACAMMQQRENGND
jgi:hypothetical protein